MQPARETGMLEWGYQVEPVHHSPTIKAQKMLSGP